MDTSDNIGLPYIMPSQAQKHVTHNEAIGMLDALVLLAVADRDLSAPPGSPSAGSRYIVAPGGTGAWDGEDGKIAHWLDGAWSFYAPKAGWLAFVVDEAALVYWTGSAWADYSGSITELQNLAWLGLGTTADATNHFAAKLNKALWTAKAVAEGGDGDLRYTMNKETAANVLSLLLQSNWSGRVELGLIGDDNFSLKVSPDGSSWITALTVDRSTGEVSVPGQVTLGASTLNVRSTRVGIGTTSPNANTKLHVFTSAFGGTQPTLLTQMVLESASSPSMVFQSPNGTVQSIYFRDNDNAASGASGYVRYDHAGDVMSFSVNGERLRLDANGVSVGGANVVIDANRHLRLRSYTIATLPAASAAAGQVIYCSDLGGGGGELVSDGTNWRRATLGGHQTVATDANLTLTPLASAEQQRHTGTLTADRTITLSTTNAYAGARFRVTRTGGGAFNLSLGGLKNLAANTWAEAVHDGTAWYLAAHGAL